MRTPLKSRLKRALAMFWRWIDRLAKGQEVISLVILLYEVVVHVAHHSTLT
jgi:hypothetical protein